MTTPVYLEFVEVTGKADLSNSRRGMAPAPPQPEQKSAPSSFTLNANPLNDAVEKGAFMVCFLFSPHTGNGCQEESLYKIRILF